MFESRELHTAMTNTKAQTHCVVKVGKEFGKEAGKKISSAMNMFTGLQLNLRKSVKQNTL